MTAAPVVLTAEMARLMIFVLRKEPMPDDLALTIVNSDEWIDALRSIASGSVVCRAADTGPRWVTDRDPLIDEEVITLNANGLLGTWLGDKDENPGDWKRKWGSWAPSTHWLDGLELPNG